jgi:hypothetical protein
MAPAFAILTPLFRLFLFVVPIAQSTLTERSTYLRAQDAKKT